MVVPSSAVTVTVTVLFPACRLVRPVTATVATDEVAVAETATAAVPLAKVTVDPAATVAPLTVRDARVESWSSSTTRTRTR